MSVKLGPLKTNGKKGAAEVVVAQLGEMWIQVRGTMSPDVDWRLVVVVNGQARIGRTMDYKGGARFSTQLWDQHHARWTKRRSYALTQLIGVVRGDEPGLKAYGVPLALLKPVPPKIEIVPAGAPVSVQRDGKVIFDPR